MSGQCTGTINITIPCITTWQCESPLNGYEKDSCNPTNRRLNPACNPLPSYREANLTSCTTLVTSVDVGIAFGIQTTIMSGTHTENYKLVLSGGIVGQSISILTITGTPTPVNQVNNWAISTIGLLAGQKNFTATLTKVT